VPERSLSVARGRCEHGRPDRPIEKVFELIEQIF
jgi:hypothetical protein